MTLDTIRPTSRRPDRRGSWLWSRAHFLLRVLGITGLLVLGVGLVLALRIDRFYDSWRVPYHILGEALRGSFPEDEVQKIGVYCLLIGGAAILAALAVELLVLLFFVAGRRSLMGFNAMVQIGLAAALLVGVNVFAFYYPLRADCTRDAEFTLPPKIQDKLQHLNRETTIVVYQAHQSLTGADEKKRDVYDKAAERKVVELVDDLVEQFRQVGPQFQVVTLDSEDLNFGKKLKELTEDPKHPRPKLREAVEAAPESCIFFYQDQPYDRPDGTTTYRDGRVQQLSFGEFFQLDKTASKEGNGNLVLLAQGEGDSGRGVETLAHRIFEVDQRRPRIGILVIHEELTSRGSDDVISLKGLRELLEARGFEVRDVVLKKGWRTGNIQPAADTREEGRLETLDAEIDELDSDIKEMEREIKNGKALVADWSLKPGEDEAAKLDYLSRKYTLPDGRRVRVTSELRKRQLDALQQGVTQLEEMLEERKSDLEKTNAERSILDLDGIAENKRMTDMHAKLQRVLADCDLLLIPRLTRGNGFFINPRLHNLDAQQVSAIKAFVASGKPILACLGPTSTPGPGGDFGGSDDQFEKMLAELGIRLNKQTILFSSDARAFASQRSSISSAGSEKVPPLDFINPATIVRGHWLPSVEEQHERANPLREGLRVTARSADQDFNLHVHFPRPVYYDPTPAWAAPVDAANCLAMLAGSQNTGALSAAAPVQLLRREAALAALPTPRSNPMFLVTAVGWNDERAFPSEDEPAPRFRPPKSDDPLNGTLGEKRRGPFPIGVAVAVPIPADWSPPTPTQARIAVIGQADMFTGNKLEPANQRLCLETVNWLLGREDYLPTANHPWRYPRIEMSETAKELWQLGCWVGMPAVFFYLGIVVLLLRRLR